MQECTSCHLSKGSDDFWEKRTKCKMCTTLQIQARNSAKPRTCMHCKISLSKDFFEGCALICISCKENKKCIKCGSIKPIEEMQAKGYVCRKCPIGHKAFKKVNTCNVCRVEKSIESFPNRRLTCFECKEENKPTMKICKDCVIEMDIKEFPYNRARCKKCYSVYLQGKKIEVDAF